MYKVKTALQLHHFQKAISEFQKLTFKERLNANLTFDVEMSFIQHENKKINILISIGHLHDDLFLQKDQNSLRFFFHTVKPLLSGPPIKRTPSIKGTLSRVLKLTSYTSLYNEPLFSRHIY